MNHSKFQVYDFSGKVKGRFLINERSLVSTIPKVTKKHHIMIVDRSGSMSGCMGDLKESLKKILALHEYMDESMLVSLISYSSKGDLTMHFVAKPVTQIDVSEIDRLRATSSTCISQSLQAIRSIINKDHATGITLHSDGYANDPSCFMEKQAIFAACAQLAKENVFINTVAHSDYADFQLLSAVANKVSGRCIKVNGVKQLYDSIVGTFDVLKSGSVAVSHVDMNDDNYLVYMSNDGKIIGSSSPMDLAGVNAKDSGSVYGFKEVDEIIYRNSSLPELYPNKVGYAFARAKLSEGYINLAKYIVSSVGDMELLEKYWRVSTAPEMAKFAKELEDLSFGKKTSSKILNSAIKINDSVTVLNVLSTIDQFKGSLVLDVDKFLENYDRRGIKRIPGKRDENGNLTEPSLEIELTGDKDRATIMGIDVSTTSANVSLSVVQKCRLVKKSDKTPITQVAGVMVDSLSSYRSYTIVGDGELTVNEIPVFISEPSAFNAFNSMGVLHYAFDGHAVSLSDRFDFKNEYKIVLSNLPITKVSVDSNKLETAIRKIFLAKILGSFCEAVVKKDSDKFSPEQVDELSKHYLSKNLNINFPTTTPYANLDDAIASGKIDVRNSFKVRFGIDGIYGMDSFRSANEFINRFYEIDGEEKCNCTDVLTDPKFIEKKLSSKAKNTLADILQKSVFDSLLFGKKDIVKMVDFLNEAKLDDLEKVLLSGFGAFSEEDLVKAFTSTSKAIDKYAQSLYMEYIFPVSFYIGSFGMAPDDWNSPVLSAEDVKKQWPDAKIGKAEADGIFFKNGGMIWGITSEKRYVSID